MNGDLRENCRLLDEKLHRAVNPDMHVRFFRTFSRDAAVYYVDGLISTDFMQHYLLSPLQNAAETASSGEIAGCIRQRVALCEVEAFFDVREIVAQLVSGHAVVLADGVKVLPASYCVVPIFQPSKTYPGRLAVQSGKIKLSPRLTLCASGSEPR